MGLHKHLQDDTESEHRRAAEATSDNDTYTKYHKYFIIKHLLCVCLKTYFSTQSGFYITIKDIMMSILPAAFLCLFHLVLGCCSEMCYFCISM